MGGAGRRGDVGRDRREGGRNKEKGREGGGGGS